MKIRNGFVSNSSSSSFIVTQTTFDWLSEKGFIGIKLTEEQIDIIAKDYHTVHATDEPLYLTSYISDGCDEHWELLKYSRSNTSIEYDEGNHGNPYDIDNFIVIKDDGQYQKIYIKKEHYIGE